MIEATSPRQAYEYFLRANKNVKPTPVYVEWGLLGKEAFWDHVRNAEVSASVTTPLGNDNPNQLPDLPGHKAMLRANSAYPGLRVILVIIACLTAAAFVIAGVQTNGAPGFLLCVAGLLFASLQYFFSSVYFDIADSSLYTSHGMKEFHARKSSLESQSPRN
jgi:hypothetical protein